MLRDNGKYYETLAVWKEMGYSVGKVERAMNKLGKKSDDITYIINGYKAFRENNNIPVFFSLVGALWLLEYGEISPQLVGIRQNREQYFQADGSVSAGLKGSGPDGGECGGSALGSQVYYRSDWYRNKWAIIHRKTEVPVDKEYVEGSSVKLESHRGFGAPRPKLRFTVLEGGAKDLITWEQLTDAACIELY
ncbi:hypothetical protein L916_02876 [Phytophthora nicotianae]|uniref:Uncharacterized protein n=1 Tax=Phytophthora nicotianae TaxID=4792 RepID=W2JLP5_PHYNI|nr:hypothetical protein L916_02876 [Phytophthora nicotianae]